MKPALHCRARPLARLVPARAADPACDLIIARMAARAGRLGMPQLRDQGRRLVRNDAVGWSSRRKEAEREVNRARQPRYLGCYAISCFSTAWIRIIPAVHEAIAVGREARLSGMTRGEAR